MMSSGGVSSGVRVLLGVTAAARIFLKKFFEGDEEFEDTESSIVLESL